MLSFIYSIFMVLINGCKKLPLCKTKAAVRIHVEYWRQSTKVQTIKRIIVPISLSVIISQNVPLQYAILFSSTKLVFLLNNQEPHHMIQLKTLERTCLNEEKWSRKSGIGYSAFATVKWGIESFNRIGNFIIGNCWIIGTSNNTIGCYCQLFELGSWICTVLQGVSYYW